MSENISLIIDSQKNFESVTRMATQIKDDSHVFKKRAIETRIKLLLARYSVFIAIGAILILFIIFKFYF